MGRALQEGHGVAGRIVGVPGRVLLPVALGLVVVLWIVWVDPVANLAQLIFPALDFRVRDEPANALCEQANARDRRVE